MFAIYYCEGKTKIVTKLIGRGGQIVCNIHTPCILVTSRSRPAEGRPRPTSYDYRLSTYIAISLVPLLLQN